MVKAVLKTSSKAVQGKTPTQSRNRLSGRARGRIKTTFRRKALEEAFVKYCQLSSEVVEEEISKTEFEELAKQASDFIDSSDFSQRGADGAILGDDFLHDCGDAGQQRSAAKSLKRLNLPPHLASMCEDMLLSPEQERKLFQRMNYLRFKADRLLSSLTPGTASQWDIERARGLMRAADWHRDCIVRANIRLVISIVKKFVNQQCGFDDLLSDGIMALIRSVDKFDYQLGFRFSTYATQVVRRNSYRFVMERQDERLKVANSISEQGLDVAEDSDPSTMSEHRWNTLRSHLGELLNQLDKREKFIIRARFSLGGHRKVQTLQCLANRLGISKERVRQLEKRAMDKLQGMAASNPPEIVEIEG